MEQPERHVITNLDDLTKARQQVHIQLKMQEEKMQVQFAEIRSIFSWEYLLFLAGKKLAGSSSGLASVAAKIIRFFVPSR